MVRNWKICRCASGCMVVKEQPPIEWDYTGCDSITFEDIEYDNWPNNPGAQDPVGYYIKDGKEMPLWAVRY